MVIFTIVLMIDLNVPLMCLLKFLVSPIDFQLIGECRLEFALILGTIQMPICYMVMIIH